LIQNTDTVAVAMTGMVQARTPAELDAQGMFFDLSEVLQHRSSGYHGLTAHQWQENQNRTWYHTSANVYMLTQLPKLVLKALQMSLHSTNKPGIFHIHPLCSCLHLAYSHGQVGHPFLVHHHHS
jgi:hypothetical protein